VRTSARGGHAVVALRGELDAAGAVCAAVAVTAAGDRVIVDLSALKFIDCCALGALLRAQERARLAGGDVLLAAPQELVRRVLDLTGIADMFGVFASVPAAAASTGCRAARRPPAVRGPSAGQCRPVSVPAPAPVDGSLRGRVGPQADPGI
jgi:anti-sigma B factor antagonist